jgi:hypothetical protein
MRGAFGGSKMLRIIGLIAAGLLLTNQAQAAPWCSAGSASEPVIQSLQREADGLTAPQPRAVERVHTESTLPHQGIRDQSLEAEKDLVVMRDLALIWRSTHNQIALNRVATLLDAWASTYQPSFQPVDETVFDSMIDAYAITRTSLPAATLQKMEYLLRNWSKGYSDYVQSPNASRNNWSSHRIKLATMAAAALGDRELFDAARAAFKEQIGLNLHQDGESMDFVQRDALFYQVYDLEALVRAVMAARTRGEDWLTMPGANGATVLAGLNWLVPYARGERTHQEFVHSTVSIDAQKAQAGVAGYAGKWEPKNGGKLYWLAATVNPAYRPVAQAIVSEPAWITACWR